MDPSALSDEAAGLLRRFPVVEELRHVRHASAASSSMLAAGRGLTVQVNR